MQLHITNKNYSSWSLRPWVLMRMLDIPFEERLHPMEPAGDWRALRVLSPTGKVPCLADEGRIIWDSLAIVEYLYERWAAVWPADRGARAWARCAAAEMHSGFGALRHECSMSVGVRVRLDRIGTALGKDLTRLAALWSDGLARFGGPWLAGASFTAVDAFFAPVAFRAQTYGLVLGPEADAYAARLRELAPMRAWYEAGLAEPWREPEHDAGCLVSGTLVADLRAPAA